VLIDPIVDHGGIGQGSRCSETTGSSLRRLVAGCGDMILPERGLRQSQARTGSDREGDAIGPMACATMPPIAAPIPRLGSAAGHQSHIGVDALALMSCG